MGETHSSQKIISILFFCIIIITSCTRNKDTSDPAPLFPNSIVSTDIDFIRYNDPDAFIKLEYIGQEDKEMPDNRTAVLFDTNTYVFEASFSNNKIVEIWAHSSFGNQNAAEVYADKLTGRLGKLPEFMRDVLSRTIKGI